MFKTQTKLKYGFLYLAAIFAVFLFMSNNAAFAVKSKIGGVTVITDGWQNATNGLGENKVFIDANKISLDTATSTTVSGNLSIVQSQPYTYEQMQNGTYDSQRGTKETFEVSYRSNKYLTISKSAVTGMSGAASGHNISVPGSAVIKWAKAAKDQNGSEYDVEMTIDNVTYYASGSRHHSFGIFWTFWHSAFNALQEHPVSELNDHGTYYGVSSIDGYFDGVQYDVTIKLYKTGTSTLIDSSNSAMAMSFEDFDVRDGTRAAINNGGVSYWEGGVAPTAGYPQATDCTGSTSWTNCVITLNPNRTGISNRYYRQGSTPNEYTESITILSGLKDNKVFSYNTDQRVNTTDDEDGTTLYFSQTDDSKLRISGTAFTGSDNDYSQNASRFLALVDARGFKYHWAGSNCGTKVGFIGSKIVKTTKGSYADHITITETDNDVLWRENKTVTIEVDEGYYIPYITIDGKGYPSYSGGAPTVLTYSRRTAGKRIYTYTFSDVVEDHEILVNAAPLTYTICKKDISGNNLSGAVLQLTSDESDAFSSDNIPSSSNVIIENSSTLRWTTETSCVTLRALSSGTYTLKELVAPENYVLATDITFVVSGSGSSDNTISSATPSSAKTGTRQITMIDAAATEGGVRIYKYVRGAGADTNKDFTISLTITSNGNNSALSTIPYIKTTSSGSTSGDLTVSSNKVSFTLKGGEYITLTMLSGYSYSVTESSYAGDGYTTTYTGQTGTVSGNGSYNIVQVTNTKNGPTVTGVDFDVGAAVFVLSGMMIAGAGAYIVWRMRR